MMTIDEIHRSTGFEISFSRSTPLHTTNLDRSDDCRTGILHDVLALTQLTGVPLEID